LGKRRSKQKRRIIGFFKKDDKIRPITAPRSWGLRLPRPPSRSSILKAAAAVSAVAGALAAAKLTAAPVSAEAAGPTSTPGGVFSWLGTQAAAASAKVQSSLGIKKGEGPGGSAGAMSGSRATSEAVSGVGVTSNTSGLIDYLSNSKNLSGAMNYAGVNPDSATALADLSRKITSDPTLARELAVKYGYGTPIAEGAVKLNTLDEAKAYVGMFGGTVVQTPDGKYTTKGSIQPAFGAGMSGVFATKDDAIAFQSKYGGVLEPVQGTSEYIVRGASSQYPVAGLPSAMYPSGGMPDINDVTSHQSIISAFDTAINRVGANAGVQNFFSKISSPGTFLGSLSSESKVVPIGKWDEGTSQQQTMWGNKVNSGFLDPKVYGDSPYIEQLDKGSFVLNAEHPGSVTGWFGGTMTGDWLSAHKVSVQSMYGGGQMFMTIPTDKATPGVLKDAAIVKNGASLIEQGQLAVFRNADGSLTARGLELDAAVKDLYKNLGSQFAMFSGIPYDSRVPNGLSLPNYELHSPWQASVNAWLRGDITTQQFMGGADFSYKGYTGKTAFAAMYADDIAKSLGYNGAYMDDYLLNSKNGLKVYLETYGISDADINRILADSEALNKSTIQQMEAWQAAKTEALTQMGVGYLGARYAFTDPVTKTTITNRYTTIGDTKYLIRSNGEAWAEDPTTHAWKPTNSPVDVNKFFATADSEYRPPGWTSPNVYAKNPVNPSAQPNPNYPFYGWTEKGEQIISPPTGTTNPELTQQNARIEATGGKATELTNEQKAAGVVGSRGGAGAFGSASGFSDPQAENKLRNRYGKDWQSHI